MSDYLAIKAVEGEQGEWLLDVLGLPYGGPNNGRDADGEYFSPETRTHEDKFGLPPVVYYHGLDDSGLPSGAPQYIGRTLKRWRDAAGEWFRVALDQTNAYAQRVWAAAKNGMARASSGSIRHLVRKGADGHLAEWPVAELSIFDAVGNRHPANAYAVAYPVMKAIYDAAGLRLPDDIAAPEATPEGEQSPAVAESETPTDQQTNGAKAMEMQEVQAMVDAALKAERERVAAEQARAAEIETAKAEAVKAAQAEWEKQAAESGRLPTYEGMPYVKKFDDRKYDNVDADGLAVMIGVLQSAKVPVSEGAYKALALRLDSTDEKPSEASQLALKALKAEMGGAYKSNEIMQSTLSNYGDQWVGVQYSTRLWEMIRAGSVLVAKIPEIEVPQGMESITLPIEGADPTWYKVAQAASLPTTEATGWPNATITSSQFVTANASLTLAKAGARVLWTGEMNEDSLIPFLPELQAKLAMSGAETLEHVVIDGDTDTTATTNINDIVGTPAGTEAFLLADGFRKLALITNTANARDAGTLTVDDYLETAKLMGTAGLNSADRGKVTFIPDANVYWKTLALEEVKTRDVASAPTLENGQLTRIWGYDVIPSWQMHKGSTVRKATTAGCIDIDTTTNNTTGSILAVRWDQWKFGWRRRQTMETTRIARADSWEIVSLMRFGLKYRDTEAAAISYNITV